MPPFFPTWISSYSVLQQQWHFYKKRFPRFKIALHKSPECHSRREALYHTEPQDERLREEAGMHAASVECGILASMLLFYHIATCGEYLGKLYFGALNISIIKATSDWLKNT